MSTEKLLHIYLRDHLAIATAGYELSKRAASSNQGWPLGNFLTTLISELQDDRDYLARIMSTLGTSPDRLKQTAATIAEKAGRLKLNGRLRGYSGLSRLIELEGLCCIAEMNLCGWRTLMRLAENDHRLADFDFESRTIRAQRHRDELEAQRAEAVTMAFA